MIAAVQICAALGSFHDRAGPHSRGERDPRPAFVLSRYRHESGRARRTRSHGECDPRARHGRRRAGEVRSSGPADGRRRHRDGTVHALPQIRSRRSGMARSRSLRAFGRSRLDACLRAAASSRLREDDDRRDQTLSAAGLAHARSSRIRPHARRRDHDGSARSRDCQRGRHGDRRTSPRRFIRRRYRRSRDVCARVRWRSNGRHQSGSDRVGRTLEAEQTHRAV